MAVGKASSQRDFAIALQVLVDEILNGTRVIDNIMVQQYPNSVFECIIEGNIVRKKEVKSQAEIYEELYFSYLNDSCAKAEKSLNYLRKDEVDIIKVKANRHAVENTVKVWKAQ